MQSVFTAFRIHVRDQGVSAGFERLTLADLTPGDVVIRISHSSVNYKDALAASGKGRILRRSPLVGGIDLAGTVVEAPPASGLAAGDAVLVTGAGLSETRDGGYAQYARVPAELAIPIPAGLDATSAMALGTAGYTAGRAIVRMERMGQTPALGPVVVTGASGGVGSLAVNMLSGRGYEVVAVSGKPAADEWLRVLGAKQILRRQEIALGSQPLESARWGGGVDSVGGDLLAWLLRTTRDGGCVASIGLAASATLHTTVMPFILREVSLLGINSVANTRASRLEVWSRLATDLRPAQLAQIVTRTVELPQLPRVLSEFIDAGVTGRTVVHIGELP